MPKLKKEDIEFIFRYSQKMLPKWRTKISKNIVGIHYGAKEKKNVPLKSHALIFHVKEKLSHPLKQIPKEIPVTLKSGKTVIVKTDVIETGRNRLLSIMMGDKAKTRETGLEDFGTAGVFMKKNDRYYVCSNMHVLAPQLLSRGSVEVPLQDQKLNVRLFNIESSAFAYLEKASFRSIDLAIARIDRPGLISNRVKSIGTISGEANIDALHRGDKVLVSGAKSGLMQGNIEILNVAKIVEYDGKETMIPNLMAIKCEADFGDSGSPVLLQNNKALVGILVSMDELRNIVFVIKIDTIKRFTKAQLIINRN